MEKIRRLTMAGFRNAARARMVLIPHGTVGAAAGHNGVCRSSI
jgi:hypothetical protein